MGLEVPPEMKQFTANLVQKRTNRAARQSTDKYKKSRSISKNTKYQKYGENEFKYKPKEKVTYWKIITDVIRALICQPIHAADVARSTRPKPKIGMRSTFPLVL